MLDLLLPTVNLNRAKSASRALAIVCLLVISYGCQSNQKEKAIMQSQISAMNDKVDFMYNNVKAQADVAANLEELQNSIVTLTGQIEELNFRSQKLGERLGKVESNAAQQKLLEHSKTSKADLNRLNADLKRLSLDILAFIELMEMRSGISQSAHKEAIARLTGTAARPEARPETRPEARTEAAPVSGETRIKRESGNPDNLYKWAYNAYLNGRYDEAIEGFTSYLDGYPKTQLSDNAAYWIGESHFGKAAYEPALRAFDKMVEAYPDSNKAPSALLKSAFALQKINDNPSAQRRLRRIIERYPNSNEAIQASERLEAGGQDKR